MLFRSKPKSNQSSTSQLFTYAVIPVALVLSIVLYKFVLGNPGNFLENNPENNPLPGNYLGIVYKGGVIVPILMSTLLIVITFCIERFATINRSRGKKNVDAFLMDVRNMMNNGDIDKAIAACNAQKGSIANVVQAGLKSYAAMSKEAGMDKEHKVAAIQKSIEETTSLE